jgi:TRAP transporter TAXI family solute receptor
MAIRIGTAERDGTFHSQGLTLKAVLDRHQSLGAIEVIESSSASIENANRLHAGEIELGFMASNWIGRAKNGEPPFTQPIDIRMVAPMNAGPLFFVTRADADIGTVADLRGRRVAVGMKTSGMVQHAHNIFEVLGLSFSDFTPVYLDFVAGADALVAGEVDAQLQCPIPNKVMTELSECTAVQVLPYAAGDLDRLMKAVSFYRPVIMRKGAIRGLDEDVAQPAVVNVLATHARVDEAIVREVVMAIVASADELGRRNPLFAGLRELFEPLRRQGVAALSFGGVALHPGAIAAYRAAGLLGDEAAE